MTKYRPLPEILDWLIAEAVRCGSWRISGDTVFLSGMTIAQAEIVEMNMRALNFIELVRLEE